MNHIKHDITEEQRANLKKLAEYLKGDLMAKFDMAVYAEEPRHNRSECGSVGCAVGHGPYAGIKKEHGMLWNRYSHVNFGAYAISHLYMWLFSDEWQFVDNTPAGASKRIEYFLANGIPENYLKQIHQEEPYIFKNI